jgi:hypothetical protein
MSSSGSTALIRRLVAAQAAPVIGAIGMRRSTPFSPSISSLSPAAISSCGGSSGSMAQASLRSNISALEARHSRAWTPAPLSGQFARDRDDPPS